MLNTFQCSSHKLYLFIERKDSVRERFGDNEGNVGREGRREEDVGQHEVEETSEVDEA